MRTEQTRTRKHGTEVINPTNFEDQGMARINAIKRIVDNEQYAKIDGCMIDLFSASAIIKVYDAINEDNKAKYRTKTAPVMANIAFELLK
jgi:hypothetical protein